MVEVTLQGTAGTIEWSAISLAKYNARTCYQYPETVPSSAHVPLLAYTANSQSIQSIGCTPERCSDLSARLVEIAGPMNGFLLCRHV